MTIKEVLATLDPEDQSLWTEDGLPTVDAVQVLLGNETITRAQISEADPEFCRDKAKVGSQPPVSLKADPVESLEDQIRELDGAIQDLTVEQNRVSSEIARLARLRAAVQTRLNGQDTSENDTQGRINYIKRQNELRADRMARRNQTFAGLDPATFSGKAPIDQAMARKKGFGTQRPVRPLAPKPTQE